MNTEFWPRGLVSAEDISDHLRFYLDPLDLSANDYLRTVEFILEVFDTNFAF